MKKIILNSIVLLTLLIACNGQNNSNQQDMDNDQYAYTNHLIHESSPYLLQHAHNPVNWYPWGEEALAKAKQENKMLIISIGYAACHWCHVMEHETFEDSTAAAYMNEHFVSIKIDREERPDIDDVYMKAAMLIKGSGGWPLNVVAMPDGRPVYAGTYFPTQNWLDMLAFYVDLYQNQKEKLENQANQLSMGIRDLEVVPKNTDHVTYRPGDLDNMFDSWHQNMDYQNGGSKGAPKFPMPNNYEYLLQYFALSGNRKALDITLLTLDKMALGGIYDQIGGGFARYSTDRIWKVPHFEKMLYDNAQLVSLYSHAFQVSGNPLYERIVKESLAFIDREMTNPDGGFYSSLDADSEGEEGKFYVWTKSELDSLLGDDNPMFCDYYNITSHGNWENGKNIPLITDEGSKVATKYGLSENEFKARIENNKKKCLAYRNKRVHPGLDDKILTSWNALMLKGYVDAYRAFGNPEYLESALKNAIFLKKNALQKDFRLNRNFKDGKSVINAFLDDYALLIQAMIDLYQATFDEQWLYLGKNLNDYVLKHFYDSESGMFYYTSDLDDPLIARKQELSDNVIPGSNSMMARNLFVLGHYFENSDYLEKSGQMLKNMKEQILPNPRFYANWALLMSSEIYPPLEIAIVGPDYEKLKKEMDRHFLPNSFLMGGSDEGTLPLLEFKLQDDKTLIYVCRNKVCDKPVDNVEEAIRQIKAMKNK
jgi:uncharacterized protein